MNNINKLERTTQDRIVQLFTQDLGYEYLGNLYNPRTLSSKTTLWLAGRNYGL